MLIDSHCHLNMLNLDNYDGDLDKVIHSAASKGVGSIICISVDLATLPDVLSIADRFEHVYATVGIHPSEQQEKPITSDVLVDLAKHPKVVAIGETGLDYYYNDTGFDLMQDQFRHHIQAARQLNKPLVIHSRDARKDTIAILKEEQADSVGGVMHCFTESWEMAQQALDLGFYISFSGIVTFKNAKNVQEVAAKVPLDRILVETDAPYLTPVPYRGKPNYPEYVTYVAEKLAELHSVSVEEITRVTTENCSQLFSIPIKI